MKVIVSIFTVAVATLFISCNSCSTKTTAPAADSTELVKDACCEGDSTCCEGDSTCCDGEGASCTEKMAE